MRLEKNIWPKLRDHVPAHWQRIESALTGRGIPDINGCRNGVEIWIEGKFVKGGKKVGLRPEQVAWHMKRTHAGGRTYFLAMTPDLVVYVWKGERAIELQKLGLRLEPDFFTGQPIDWTGLTEYLFS